LVRSSEEAAAASREDTSIGRVRMGLMLEVLMLGDGRARGGGEASLASPPPSSEAVAMELSESWSEWGRGLRSWMRLGDDTRPAPAAPDSEWRLGERSPRRFGEGTLRPVPASASATESRWWPGGTLPSLRLGDGGRPPAPASAAESDAAVTSAPAEAGAAGSAAAVVGRLGGGVLERDRERGREGVGEGERRRVL
jgi:hypothetical protein